MLSFCIFIGIAIASMVFIMKMKGLEADVILCIFIKIFETIKSKSQSPHLTKCNRIALLVILLERLSSIHLPMVNVDYAAKNYIK